MHDGDELIVRFEDRIFVWMPAVTLLWTSLDGTNKGIDDRLMANASGRPAHLVAAIVHLPQDLTISEGYTGWAISTCDWERLADNLHPILWSLHRGPTEKNTRKFPSRI